MSFDEAMARVTVTREPDGSVRIPAELLRQLELADSDRFHLDADKETGLLHVYAADDEDAWLYESEEVEALLARARADVAAGRLRKSSEAELRSLAPAD